MSNNISEHKLHRITKVLTEALYRLGADYAMLSDIIYNTLKKELQLEEGEKENEE